MAERLAHQGVTYLDAPVTGGTEGARAGTLTVLVGGNAQVLAKVQPRPIFAPNIRSVNDRVQGKQIQMIFPKVPQISRTNFCFGVQTVRRSGGASSIADFWSFAILLVFCSISVSIASQGISIGIIGWNKHTFELSFV